MQYKNKKIAVLGFGSSGEAAARLLAEEGAMTTILDSADLKKLTFENRKDHAAGHFGAGGPGCGQGPDEV